MVGGDVNGAILDYFSKVAVAGTKGVKRHLMAIGAWESGRPGMSGHLDELVAEGALLTEGGVYCLSSNAEALDKRFSGTKKKKRKNGFGSGTKLGEAIAKHRRNSERKPALRRTRRSGTPVSGGEGNCDRCGIFSKDRNRFEHTNWGTVSLCKPCCLEIQDRPTLKRVRPRIRFISTPMGGKPRKS